MQTPAEVTAYMVHRLSVVQAAQAEMLHDCEMACRAANLDRVSLREARDVLARLSYPRDLVALLTKLARRAPKRPAGNVVGNAGRRKIKSH